MATKNEPETPDIPDNLRDDTSTQAVLERSLHQSIDRNRRSYLDEWERHERLSKALTSLSPNSHDLLADIAMPRPHYQRELDISDAVDAIADNQLQVLENRTGELAKRLSVRGRPYDLQWISFEPEGARGTAARGPGVYLPTGLMTLDLTETYVDRPVAHGGWMTNAAGVGVWFKPKSTSTYVRVAPYMTYRYRWKNDSNLQVARNRGAIACTVIEHGGPTLVDVQKRLWNDGTGWYEVHEDEQSGTWTDSHYFWASSKNWYAVWFWCSSSIDFATKTTFGSSRAYNTMTAKVPWIVFEQWA